MARTLFGTDGIRGIANEYPLTAEIVLELGRAVAHHFRNGRKPQVVIGKDTRLSGYLFENALTAGLLSAGATVFLVGPLPTPAVAHITRSFGADAGIMITASHNPAEHNGIKLFDGKGYKVSDEKEEAIERSMLESLERKGKHDLSAIGKAIRIDDARGRYIEFAKSTIKSVSLKGLKVVLDCANGAAYSITPVILQELGAEVIKVGTTPDGLNINDGCGALYPENLGKIVTAQKADIGIALDGDADRVIMVDKQGSIVDGDKLLALLAIDMKRKGILKQKTVVGTQYTNKGFDEAMEREGITVERVANGDRYIIDRLREKGYSLGGEQTGHLILFEHATTGDGTIAALQILRLMQETGKPLHELATVMACWPQRVESFPVTEKRPLKELPKVEAAIADAERDLGDEGRVFVRYSGTEKKVRIMVEAKDSALIDRHLNAIAHAFAPLTEAGE